VIVFRPMLDTWCTFSTCSTFTGTPEDRSTKKWNGTLYGLTNIRSKCTPTKSCFPIWNLIKKWDIQIVSYYLPTRIEQSLSLIQTARSVYYIPSNFLRTVLAFNNVDKQFMQISHDCIILLKILSTHRKNKGR